MTERHRVRAAEPQADDQRAQEAADRIGEAIRFPVAVARRVLPDRELPVFLGVGALAVAGVIDWPVAAAAGLGFAALRRWGRAREAGGQPERRAEDERRAARVRSDGMVTSSRHTITRH